jgi:1-acyl-sn-glycerol-3-phosphate acyltransferase
VERDPPDTPVIDLTDADPLGADPLGAARARRAGRELVPVPRLPEPAVEDLDGALSDVDGWGRSEHMRQLIRAVYDPIYTHWFRAEWDGLEHIPASGGALLVANHAGAVPSDAPVIMHGIEKELGRPVYGLADFFFRTLPVAGTLWSRGGGVTAHPHNAPRRLHDEGRLALVFPEGVKGPSKLYKDRYQLRRFGRGGFVETAMRAGVPIVPIAVVGAEESMPILARSGRLAKMLRVPYLPFTANMALLGPFGLFGYFPAKFKLRVLEPVHFDVPAGRERYPRSRVMEESEAIRTRIQEALYDMLSRRRSVWFG